MFLDYNGLQPWPTKLAVALLWLVLVTSWGQFLLSVLSGTILASFLQYMLFDFNFYQSNISYSDILNSFWIVVIAGVFSLRQETLQQAKLKSLQSLAGAIAHEMRTPLFNMIGKLKGLKGKINLLIEDYRYHYGDEDPQEVGNLDVISSLPDDLQKTTEHSLNIIEIILTSLNTKFSEKEFQLCSILSVVEDALKNYPLTKTEKKLINTDKIIDFQIYGHPFLLKHVLFNLLKNSLHYIKVAGKGQIYIWTEKTDKQYKLYFKDTGSGMPKEMAEKVFDDFFSKTDYGTGIGLSFCKKVIIDMGGKISCDAVDSEYVQFILTFPPLK